MKETPLTQADLKSAVQTGVLSEAQAAQVLALAHARLGARSELKPSEEPFELFKGFNEIFIVIGLFILYLGWFGIGGVTFALSAFTGEGSNSAGFIFGGIGAFGAAMLAWYFTLKRRMVAPSIFLTAVFAFSVMVLYAGFGPSVLISPSTLAIMGAVYFFLLLGWWFVFHVPFTMFLIGISGLFLVFSIVRATGGPAMSLFELFIQSGRGPSAVVTLITGLIGVCVAMTFDMSDPHRVTRRAADGFWLHVISAAMVIHTVAIRLLTSETPAASVALFAFVLFCAFFAIVVDRRSFLVSSIGYVVALAATIADGQLAFLAIFFLGLMLVLLGAFWDQIRSKTMNALPNFPGKGRMPPWMANRETLSHT